MKSIRATLSRVPPAKARAAGVVALVAAVAAVPIFLFVRQGTSDAPHQNQAPQRQQAAPSDAVPKVSDEQILAVENADDKCPHDGAEYSPAMNMFKTDKSKAWDCTRVDDKDGQHVQIELESIAELSQIRAVCGYDHVRPDRVDEWNRHRLPTEIDFYFPVDSKHGPVKLMCNGARGWAHVLINPPVLTSQILAVVVSTSDPPTPDRAQATASDSADPTQDRPPSTVAIGSMEIIGTRRTGK